ncbi:MAG TPA: trypsin-like peptidase domain-containing protein [Pseudonocardiaceae bacterium]|nr:trypsin-like peptidase domain-containing protein [Pseudonocardiaceae bacterium]
MTENFPGGPADQTPSENDPGPAESQAPPPADATESAAEPAPTSTPDPSPDETIRRPTEPSAPPAQQAYSPPPMGYPPLGQPHSGPHPIAQVPQSPWAQGYGSGYHRPISPQPGYGGYQPPNGPPTGPITTAYPMGGSGGFVVLVAVLALVIGGAAGSLGGYLVSTHDSGEVISSLDQSEPASQARNAPAGSVQAVAGKVLPVVVTIAAEFSDQSGLNGDTGSGLIISSTGDILTNNHVIADAASSGRIQVIFANGKTVDAKVVGRDPTTDIAVIKAQGVTGLPIAQLGRSADLTVGQDVVAIGAPFELSGTVTSGIISSLHRPTEAGDGNAASQTTVLDAIQTDAPINPGNSGGPLVDMQGRVIGINSAIYSPNSGGVQGQQAQGGNVGIGFAIPMDQAKRIANEIVSTGKAIQTVLGVKVEDNTPSQGGQPSILPNGALISSVTPGGPADKGGLKAGAVVVKADGRLVNSSDGLVAAVHAAAPGDKMTLTLSSGNSVSVSLSGQTVNPN